MVGHVTINGNTYANDGTGGAIDITGYGWSTHVIDFTSDLLTQLGTATGLATANRLFAGPTSGSPATPAFRTLVAADINGLSPSFVQLTSTVVTGTPPLVVSSTTKVPNLNVDQLDGADWASPAALGSSTPAAVDGTVVTAHTSVATPSITINSGTALTIYEQGSFTPTLIGTSTAGTQTYGVQIGRYTRIGNRVFVSGMVQISAKDGAMAGNAAIGGLPYAGANIVNIEQAMSVGRFAAVTLDGSYSQLMLRIAQSDVVMRLEEGGSATGVNAVAVANIGTTTFICFGGSYQA